jgi:tetratricopeptide (TPR) repeat protein
MKFNLITLLLLALFTWSCQSESNSQQASSTQDIDLPKLLDRHADLRQGTEWDQIQRLYVTQQQALRKDPQDAEAYLKLSQIFINEARITGEHGHYYPAALEVIKTGLAQPLVSPDLRFQMLSTRASVELSQHDFPNALATAEEAVKLNPYNAQIYGALVDANVELGNYTEAVAMADKMVSIRPDLRSYSRVSYLREIYGDVDGAIDALKMAVAAGFPGQEATCWARLTLGGLYETYDYPAKAKEQYELALAEREDYPFAMAKLATLKTEEGDLKGAEEELLAAAAIIPEVSFYTDLASIYKQQGDQEKLKETLAEIQLMLQDDVDSGHRMDLEYAFIYLELYESPEQALAYAQQEYERRPDNIDVNRLLARIYSAMGNQSLADQHLVKASVTNSKHPELIALVH